MSCWLLCGRNNRWTAMMFHAQVLVSDRTKITTTNKKSTHAHDVTLTFDLLTPKTERRKFGEIQKFSRYRINKAISPFSSILNLPQPWTLIFWPENSKPSSLSQNAPMLKVWRKYVQHFSRYRVNNVRYARTDTSTYEQPENVTPPTALRCMAEA